MVNLKAHGILYLLEHVLYLKLFSKSKYSLKLVNYIVYNIYNTELL